MSTSTARPVRGRRLRRGTKTEDYLAALSGEDGASTSGSSSSKLPAISSMDSPFEVQEYLAMLVAENPHDIQRLIQIPRWKRASTSSSSSSKGKQVASSDINTASDDNNPPEQSGDGSDNDDRATKGQQLSTSASSNNDEDSKRASNDGDNDNEDDEYEYVDRDVWLYEHLRRLAIDLSQPFVVTLQEHCTRETCPEMKAGEWLYLCAAHATANETECCAIDYITHTLDGATALLNSSRYFPSRINIPPTSLKHFTSIARRLYRIFAHAWYHHRELFDLCESSTSLYERFLALSIEYDLVPRELLTIPSQHEQSQSADSSDASSNNNTDSNETSSSNNEHTREHRSNTVFSRGGPGPRMNGHAKEAQEEEEQNQIQRRILEKRVLGPGYTSSGGGGNATANGESGKSNEDEDEDDDSSEESSDEELINMPPVASMAGLSLKDTSSTKEGEGAASKSGTEA
ncbi:Mob1/phocein [Cystobasidium minutum MCA 4210]|uniref:Mob1/phocein n=1 Tax=Cystobasidium minutum MCA 4210 TaxID=1397322 RepID=UPI0034CD4FAE|eukprot:jgi/Rhomi1/165742/fgenesh1_kg.1_\